MNDMTQLIELQQSLTFLGTIGGLALALLGVIFYELFDIIERRLTRWNK